MPEVRGLEFVQAQLKKGCKCHHIALISGGWSEAEQLQARQLGCQVFSKPIQIAQIQKWSDAIQKWLDAVEEKLDPERELFDKFLEEE